jgi:glycosyltransferase involved in cell wall biosynthesis
MTTRLILIHSMDPRGSKVGGIETHVRQLLRRHPADVRVTMIGIDERGDLPLGEPAALDIGGREVDFIPILRVLEEGPQGAAKSLGGSVTLRFVLAFLLRLLTLRRVVPRAHATAEVERHEFAPLARLLGVPLVLLVHSEGERGAVMDSLLKRYWWINDAAEWLALRLARAAFCVTPRLAERLRTRHPTLADRIGVLTVSVDTSQFRPAPFDLTDGTLRVLFAGRLDAFKDPPLMFAVAAALAARLPGAFEFHYAGASDPHRFAEFAAIEHCTVRHGALSTDQVAALMHRCHIGMLTSYWEGMPCFLLELLASGRPFAGLALPQFAPVVIDGVSGRMVERGDDPTSNIDRIVDAVLGTFADIRARRIDPVTVARCITPYSVERQLGRLFDAHRAALRGKVRLGDLAGSESPAA